MGKVDTVELLLEAGADMESREEVFFPDTYAIVFVL